MVWLLKWLKESINSFEELRTEENVQQLWKKAVNNSENNSFYEVTVNFFP